MKGKSKKASVGKPKMTKPKNLKAGEAKNVAKTMGKDII